jgi:hypothetical protein
MEQSGKQLPSGCAYRQGNRLRGEWHGADLLFLGWWKTEKRKQKEMGLARSGYHIEPWRHFLEYYRPALTPCQEGGQN